MKCLANGKTFPRVNWIDPPFDGDGYGHKNYLTELGELAYVNMFDQPWPNSDVWKELDYYFNIEKKKWNRHVHVDNTDTWRYFADLSFDKKLWFESNVAYSASCYDKGKQNVSELIDKEIVNVELQPLTYHCWSGLSDSKKRKAMHFLFENPVRYNEPMFEHPFHEIDNVEIRKFQFQFIGTTLHSVNSFFDDDRTSRDWLLSKSNVLLAAIDTCFTVDAIRIQPATDKPNQNTGVIFKNDIEPQKHPGQKLPDLVSFSVNSYDRIETITFELSRGEFYPRLMNIIIDLRLDPVARPVPECKLHLFDHAQDTEQFIETFTTQLHLKRM